METEYLQISLEANGGILRRLRCAYSSLLLLEWEKKKVCFSFLISQNSDF